MRLPHGPAVRPAWAILSAAAALQMRSMNAFDILVWTLAATLLAALLEREPGPGATRLWQPKESLLDSLRRDPIFI